MTRVLHTGDTHLGYQQYHVPARRVDFLDAFRQVVEDAIEMEVDAVVHAGDLFHDRRPTLPDILGTLSVLERLDGAGIPFLAIVGNHEAKRDAQWLDLFETLGFATRLDGAPVEVGDTAFYGLDFVPRSKRDDLALSFEPHDLDHAALVAHGLFEPFDLGEWDATSILDAAAVDFDAMLLGDNHDPGTAEVEGTWLTYCGSTERTSAAEREPRGYNLVTFDDGTVDVARRGLDTREFVYVDVDLAEDEGAERVRERVGEHDLEGAVVIVHVDGDGEPLAPASVEEYANERGALVARVTDHREIAEDETVEVTFADPDDAVRERLRELGLSEAARDLDETIRASKVADSRVADTVEERVRGLIEEDPDAFDSVPDVEDESDRVSENETATDTPEREETPPPDDASVREPSESPTTNDGVEPATGVVAGTNADEREASENEDASIEDDASVEDDETSVEDDETSIEDDNASVEVTDAQTDRDDRPRDAIQGDEGSGDESDGQATMEEYF